MKIELTKNKTEASAKNHGYNSTNSSRIKVGENSYKKCSWIAESNKKVNGYAIPKKNRACLARRQHNSRNYQRSTPNIEINIEQNGFNKLKKQIDQL